MIPPCYPQELFTKVAVPDHMTRYRSQSYNGNVEHLAPSVNKIIKQFDDAANLVISSCLGAPGMTARDRAQVVEFWIQMAKVCHRTAPRVHPGMLGPSPLLGQLSGWRTTV